MLYPGRLSAPSSILLLLSIVIVGVLVVSLASQADEAKTSRALAPPQAFYVAPTGQPNGDGSRERPWPSVAFALDKVGGGQTIILRPGLYQGPIVVPRQYAGREGQPTLVKSEEKWKAVIYGSRTHAVSTEDDCDWVTFDGLHVYGAIGDGVKLNGDYNTVRNCWIHHCLDMGVAMHNQEGGVIEQNLIEFNGSHIQFHHGVYADGRNLRIHGNVVRHNACFGLHLYPNLKESSVCNNVVFAQVAGRGVIIDSEGGNRFVNNTVAEMFQGLELRNAERDLVANNIIVAINGEPVDARNTQLTANLIEGDPGFVDMRRGLLWLAADSPAREGGNPQQAPAEDFWRNARQGKTDLGAIPYSSQLTKRQAEDAWLHGWPYLRGPKEKLPDLWATAPSE